MKKTSYKSKAIIKGLLDYLNQNSEQSLLGEVRIVLDSEIHKAEGADEILVTSTVKLTPFQLKNISGALYKNFKIRLPIINKIDKTLIGGFTIRIKDWFLDGSLAQEVQILKRSLMT